MSPETLAHACTALADYGPQGSDIWVEGHLGLGYRHLVVAPESRYEAQPLRQGSLALVADAILHNRDELCEMLDIPAHQRPYLPDSQLLLGAYRRWGTECVTRLHGDFAFALWDGQAQRLFAARDPVGARPFFYAHRGQCLSFASNVRGLQALADAPFPLDESRVANYLIWPLNPVEASFFKGISPLAPGYSLMATPDGLSVQRWWDPRNVPDVRFNRREEYVEQCRELLERAVNDCLRTDHPVGTHFSGGLDSTGVTILANRLLRKQGRSLDMSYTWAPPINARYPLSDSQWDERRTILEVCRREDISCHHGIADGSDYAAYCARDLAVEGHCDLFEELPVMAAAASRGTRVMLSGWGGDEALTFTTRGVAAFLLRSGRWATLLDMARRQAGGLRRWRRWSRFLWQEGCLPFMPDSVYARFSPYLNTERLPQAARSSFLSQYSSVEVGRGAIWRVYADPRRIQQALLDNGHLAARMSAWSNWAAPHRLVYRYPLTDRRILEFSLGLPRELLWQEGTSRWVYRRAMQDLLPARLGKYDEANERKRVDQLVECRQLLARQARRGAFLAPCPWLDVNLLHERLMAPPDSDPGRAIQEFVPLEAALRTWHLWQRYGAMDSQAAATY
ncbi:asparagine synthase-related protein [Halomonas sp. M5N1S17]|uniref:asparagine synthase-related protein n=1 Tax=Halomonas alkalisoli TaxID=2907158 RepID=UPI001F303EF6|nr:asparagine synthase-related protein [Halomonas alkalisoli]